MIEEKIERSRAKMEGREPRPKEISLYSLEQSFYSAGWINADQVATIEEEYGDQSFNFVHSCLPNEQISNWEFVDISMVYAQEEM